MFRIWLIIYVHLALKERTIPPSVGVIHHALFIVLINLETMGRLPINTRGRNKLRPYITYCNYSVDMIWHYHKFIAFRIYKMARDCIPTFHYDFTVLIKQDFTILNFPEYTFFVPCTYRYKICTCLRIIIILQADGTAVVFFWVITHAADTSFLPVFSVDKQSPSILFPSQRYTSS